MNFPKVSYTHLPLKLIEGQHYIGEKGTQHTLLCLDSYIEHCWPLRRDSYHCKGFNVHQKINNGHYIKGLLRYYKERNRLRTDKLYAFNSAYYNLVVFNLDGLYLPTSEHKYIQEYIN